MSAPLTLTTKGTKQLRTLLKHPAINVRAFLLSGLLLSTLTSYPQRAAIAAETVVIAPIPYGFPGGGGGEIPGRSYQVYTAPEIDTMISGIRTETIETAKGLRNDSDALKNSVKEQVLQTLNGISTKLLSDDLKNKLSQDISDSIAQRIDGELQKFKADFTKEILATVDERIKKATELESGQQ
ncbi:hypothetical protein [Rhizobium leguminosarum]|uniref:hypothetical protein n=1 Tax=Rhizobium leguminosarum TaxID=384 RepID=UPI0010312EC0|nr:hypothetical protein [Rhizobium leguminosarum]TBF82674.1 hypothetical protein ELG86_11320 [Rhizobium leguminosarum]TBH02158.1 hypothetical protein ELG70_11285 [Rhizobium leguminosarum]TBH36616.1 hypothetical protein ELG66_12615 [Rhizobium leguminosarum]TBH41818.1 hypothetical protein ELG63_10825 [Rhizobium leguminosarum]TBH66844.1 hypothetical protein ELG61_11020 [Rhizobium leguminosarum]